MEQEAITQIAEEEAITQVVEGRVCLTFEDLEPLSEEEADSLTDSQAAERMQAIGVHCHMLVEKASAIVMRFLPEIRSMRKRYSQPGRRNPIIGLPTWGKVRRAYFPFSDSHMRRLLADPKEKQPNSGTRPGEDAAEPEVEVKENPQPEAQSPVAEQTQPEAATAQAQEEPVPTGSPYGIKDHPETVPDRKPGDSRKHLVQMFRSHFGREEERAAALREFFLEVGREFHDDIFAAITSISNPDGNETELEPDADRKASASEAKPRTKKGKGTAWYRARKSFEQKNTYRRKKGLPLLPRPLSFGVGAHVKVNKFEQRPVARTESKIQRKRLRR